MSAYFHDPEEEQKAFQAAETLRSAMAAPAPEPVTRASSIRMLREEIADMEEEIEELGVHITHFRKMIEWLEGRGNE